MIFLELLLKEAGASYHPFIGFSTSRTCYLQFQMSLHRACLHDFSGWLPVTAELREEGTIILQFCFVSLYFHFDFRGWGLDITVSSVRKRGPHHSVKSGERSPSAPLDHVSFPPVTFHTRRAGFERVLYLFEKLTS